MDEVHSHVSRLESLKARPCIGRRNREGVRNDLGPVAQRYRRIAGKYSTNSVGPKASNPFVSGFEPYKGIANLAYVKLVFTAGVPGVEAAKVPERDHVQPGPTAWHSKH